MKEYTLTAKLGDVTVTETIEAKDSFLATMDAIGHIMDAAYRDRAGPWALGAIALTDSDGNVLHTMDAK